jgi:hypothetical protein
MKPIYTIRNRPYGLFYSVAFGCCAFLLTACGNDGTSAANNADSSSTINNSAPLKPKGEDPVWGKDIDDEMLVVIEKLQSYGDKPIETLSAPEARM